MNHIATPIKYSIIIPTRNRDKYLPYAIESVLSNKRTDIQLIVSNNHSVDGTANILAKIAPDPRLKVISPSDEIPMALHYEYALSQADGEWITILGDDDAVMPYFFERLDSLIEMFPTTNIISSERAYYFWEGCEDLYGDSVVAYCRYSSKSIRSTKLDLLFALAGLRSCFNLPQIYTSCIVKNSLYEKIKLQSGGSFYHSIIPDMYSAVTLSLAEKFYLRVDEPLFWTGTSSKSLGRSDRIYKDSELIVTSSVGQLSKLTLHPKIPQKLHILGFESLYLYEALLNSPLAEGFWRGHLVTYLVFADMLAKAQKKSIQNGIDYNVLKGYVYEQISLNGLTITNTRVIVFLISFVNFLIGIGKIPKMIFRKLIRICFKNSLISKDRGLFNNILKASAAVTCLSDRN